MTTTIEQVAVADHPENGTEKAGVQAAGAGPDARARACPVVILCGGQGTRIADVSSAVPKPLLPIGGMPILWHIMKTYSHQGFQDFILCLGHLGNVIEDFFSLGSLSGEAFGGLGFRPSELSERREPGWNVTFAHTGEMTPTGGRLKCVEGLIESDEFMLTYGDGLSDVALEGLRCFHQEQRRVATVTGVRPRSAFGVIEVENGLAKSFIEKPLLDHRINGGFFTFRRDFFDYVRPDEALEDLPLKRIVERGELAVYEHDGFWTCMDTRKDFDALNAMWCEGETPWKRW
jgi:glucose-1-phosphate cytidylyltransferase